MSKLTYTNLSFQKYLYLLIIHYEFHLNLHCFIADILFKLEFDSFML